MDQWLGRAAALPLTLVFRSATPDFPLNRLRSIIYRYSHQVQYLALDVGERDDIRELGLDSHAFPELRRATLNWKAPYTHDDDVPLNILGMAPQLDELHLPHAVALTAPWSQLTRFEGQIESMELFALAENLTEAKCYFFDRMDDTDIVNTSLRILTVTDDSNDILPFLTLPSLQSLDICGMDDHGSLRLFLKRSSPPLLSLCVSGEANRLDDWYPCLSLLGSNFENLEIRYVSDFVLRRLFGTNQKRNLSVLPDLKTLMCCDVQRNAVDLHQVLAFLHSRIDQLRSFRLVWETSPFLDSEHCLPTGTGAIKTVDSILGHLSRLGQSGMDIYLGTDTRNYARNERSPEEQ
ncbi:hypothetical protein B0H11DRAFT_1904157 [Mycena galericulata]|nr:hypothetical protein B0H11DRAFT_1904157 [Mycena galericulata]